MRCGALEQPTRRLLELPEKVLTSRRFANPMLQPSARPQPRHVAVIGAGAIGPDIAYYLKGALPGLRLTLIDNRQAAIDASLARLREYTD